jgi:hypothetical protein
LASKRGNAACRPIRAAPEVTAPDVIVPAFRKPVHTTPHRVFRRAGKCNAGFAKISIAPENRTP